MAIRLFSQSLLSSLLLLTTLPNRHLVLSQTPPPTNQLPTTASSPNPTIPPQVENPDPLPNKAWWKLAVNYQVARNRNQEFSGCLFGDSISSALGNTLGKGNVNFALGGMSTTSLLIQIRQLSEANVRCQHVVIAIGTNDAWYGIDDQRFTAQLKQSITLARSLGATRITLIPAFYSTVPASKNPKLAGPLPRIDQLNLLINQVANTENLTFEDTGVQSLFRNQALHDDFTHDGVHLNAAGKKIYRQVLLEILATNTAGAQK